jgi:lipopolysaccharide export system protein LptC
MAGIDIPPARLAPPVLPPQGAVWAPPAHGLSAGSPLRRRRAVRIAKYGLPLVALALLSSIAVWPELSRTLANGRVTWHRLAMVVAGSGEIVAPRYHGLDERGRPYMVSADTAERAGPERLNLTRPRGDVTLASGTWIQVQAKQGVFMQHLDELDLQGDVTLYRQDGTTMTSRTATIDVKQGAATSDEYTHAEGPFGVLDAEGFTLVDKGGLIQFHGPAKLVMNASH